MGSEANFSTTGDDSQVSPSVWADCRNTLLNDLGLGVYVDTHFQGNYPTSPGLPTDADSGTTYLQGATATYGPHVVAVLNTNTDNNAAALLTSALGKIQRGSGRRLWGEVRVAVGALGDSAFAFGFTTLANATRDIIADNPSNSARAALTAATFIGFVSVQAASALATVDAVYSKGSATPVVVLTNVTNATAIASTSRSNLVANTFVKLGLRFDGNKTLYFLVNGIKVASQEVDGTFDQATDLALVFNQKTGAATQIINYLDFFRGAAQART